MNTRTIALALFTATASIAVAQDAPQPTTATPQTETQHDMLVRELGLSAEQSTQITQIEAKHAEQVKELRRLNLDTASMQERTRALRDKKEANYKAVLTPAQYDKLLAMRKTKHDGTLERVQEAQPSHQE